MTLEDTVTKLKTKLPLYDVRRPVFADRKRLVALFEQQRLDMPEIQNYETTSWTIKKLIRRIKSFDEQIVCEDGGKIVGWLGSYMGTVLEPTWGVFDKQRTKVQIVKAVNCLSIVQVAYAITQGLTMGVVHIPIQTNRLRISNRLFAVAPTEALGTDPITGEITSKRLEISLEDVLKLKIRHLLRSSVPGDPDWQEHI